MVFSNLTTNLSIYSCAINNSKFIKWVTAAVDNLRTRLSTDERREQNHFELKFFLRKRVSKAVLDKVSLWAHNTSTLYICFPKKCSILVGGFHRVIFRGRGGRGCVRIVQFQVDMAPLMCLSFKYTIINLCIKHPSG